MSWAGWAIFLLGMAGLSWIVTLDVWLNNRDWERRMLRERCLNAGRYRGRWR